MANQINVFQAPFSWVISLPAKIFNKSNKEKAINATVTTLKSINWPYTHNIIAKTKIHGVFFHQKSLGRFLSVFLLPSQEPQMFPLFLVDRF